MNLTIVWIACAAIALILLVTILLLVLGLRSDLRKLENANGTAFRSAGRSVLATAIDDRLASMERQLADLLDATARLERTLQAGERPAPRPPMRAAAVIPESARAVVEPLTPPFRGVAPEASPPPRPNYEFRTPPLQSPSPPLEDSGDPTTPDELVDAYRELISRPRKNDINRWFEEREGLSCEAVEDDVLQLVGRGEGARLMLLPLTPSFGLVLPSGLMVADFATSFSDVLSARAALRRTFELDADGTGVLRLVDPARAILQDGVWKLKVPGRLAGLAAG